jgi:uncharacterized protein with WD repeat
MPHTITKKHRPKREDSRPSSEGRKEKHRKLAQIQEADDIRVTKKNKHDKSEREVDASETLKSSNDAKIGAEKKMKALTKKITAIEALKAKQDKGETLDEKQIAKIESLAETVQMLDDFMTGKRT